MLCHTTLKMSGNLPFPFLPNLFQIVNRIPTLQNAPRIFLENKLLKTAENKIYAIRQGYKKQGLNCFL